MKWFLSGVGVLLLLIGPLIYMSWVMAWGDRETNGLGYYGRSPQERARFKRTLRIHALVLYPFIRVLGKLSPMKIENATFHVDGVPGPKGTCTAESFAAGMSYVARPEDVFVVTQMKCGTTWMQHVVYEVLHRGQGDLVDSGTALYAVSPWLEAHKAVPMELAPLLGVERPARLVKTHLPAVSCPSLDAARYIYVARHPVSCFASCSDFIDTNAGAFSPGTEAVEAWFTSEESMWWGTWPAHVAGWWDRADADGNVLFVHFEDMKRDLRAVIADVAAFLGMQPLSEAETDDIERKCSFAYMKEHADAFEMHPPHLLQANAELFVRGTADRHRDVSADQSERLLVWCASEMKGTRYPLGESYPDVAGAVRGDG